MAIPHPNAPRLPRTPAPQPKPVNYGRTTPGTHMHGVGEKMRNETSQALEQLLKQGSFRTGLEPLLNKVAGLLRPLALTGGLALGGATALGLGGMAHQQAVADRRQRNNKVPYVQMTGVS